MKTNKREAVRELTAEEWAALLRGKALPPAPAGAGEAKRAALVWREVPFRAMPPRGLPAGGARAKPLKGGKRFEVRISSEAAAKLGLQAGDRARVLVSGLNLAFRKSAQGYKVVESGASDRGRVVVRFRQPEGWPNEDVLFRAARSGDQFYLEALV
jgi:hypothetical protein